MSIRYRTSVAESEPPGAELFCIEPYLGRLPHLFCTITVAVDLFFTYEYLLVLVDNLRIEVLEQKELRAGAIFGSKKPGAG